MGLLCQIPNKCKPFSLLQFFYILVGFRRHSQLTNQTENNERAREDYSILQCLLSSDKNKIMKKFEKIM